MQIPYAVAGVVMRCLEKDPQNRPAHAAALIGEIEWAEHAAGYAAAGSPIEGRYDRVPPAATQIGTPYSDLDVARSSASRTTGQAATLRRDEAHVDPEPKSRTGWVVGVIACLLIAGGLAAWKFWPPLAPAASSRTSAPAGQTDTNTQTTGLTGQAVTNPAGAITGSNAVESPHPEIVLDPRIKIGRGESDDVGGRGGDV